MANVKLSGLISDIRGSIAGATFQRSGSGLTMRKKPHPLKAKTNAQTQVRILQSRLNFEWLQLTDAQRNTWQSFADFTNGYGKTSKQRESANTGKMQFLTINFWILLYGKDLLTVPTFQPPLDPVIPAPPLYDRSTNLMDYDGTFDADTEILVTRVSLPQSLATRTANTGFRTLVYAQVSGNEQNWADAYLNTYGISLVTGKKYWIELQKVNYLTGSVSAPGRKLVEYQAADTSFKLTFDTTKAGSPNDTITIPCFDVGTYNAIIDWGDSSSSTITSYNDANLTHVYTSPGVYTVSITGQLPALYFNNTGDKLKLVDIVKWGGWQPQQLTSAFNGCSNLVGTATDALDASAVTNASTCFRNCSSLVIDASLWDVSSVTGFAQMFINCTSFNSDLSSWDVSSGMQFANMFAGCSVFNADLSAWNMSNALSLEWMFFNCSSFNSDISSWDVSSVTNMSRTFLAASSFNQDLSSWDVSSVTEGINFMVSTSFSTANYDLWLNAVVLLSVQSGVTWDFGTTEYTIATSGTAHTTLTSAPINWTLNDGGGI